MATVKVGKFYFDLSHVDIVEVCDDGSLRLYFPDMPDAQTSVFEVPAEDAAFILKIVEAADRETRDNFEQQIRRIEVQRESNRREMDELEEGWAKEDKKKADELSGFVV